MKYVVLLILLASCSPSLPKPGNCYKNPIIVLKVIELFKSPYSGELMGKFDIIQRINGNLGEQEITMGWFTLNDFQKIDCPIIINKEK